MDETKQLFGFEQDFANRLQCIPMATRLKLDCSGVKLTLKQWSRFEHRDREQLLQLPCNNDDEVAQYKAVLLGLIAATGGAAKEMSVPQAPEWLDATNVPQQILDFCLDRGVNAPSEVQWRNLTLIRRYVLLKLSRASHDNVNFVPAMREFGLLSPEG